MVNFGLNSASILGIFLAVAGAGLYFMRSVRPELSRDHDIFFAAVGLLCGLILLFQGWRLDPILQFGQFLLTGAAVFFAVETIRLRGATTEQAKRSSPIVDDERPVSKVYRAALEQLEPYDEEEEYETNRRLRGYSDARSGRSSGYDVDEPRSQKSRRPASSDRYNVRERETSRRPRPRPSASPSGEQPYQDWDQTPDSWEERPTSSRPRRSRPDADLSEPTAKTPRKRRPRPSNVEVASDTSDAMPTDYVDYQPIDTTQQGNSDWEQEQESGQNPNRDRNEDNPVRFDY